MKAYLFPGQGSQFSGMGKELYESNPIARELFDKANEVLGFKLTEIMFNGSDEQLQRTEITQPAVFVHSVVTALAQGEDFRPDMVAGHSLGEISALTAAGVLSFEDGLKLVYARALAMQKCCDERPGAMISVIGLPDEKLVEICREYAGNHPEHVLVAANFNSPGNVAVSGSSEAVQEITGIFMKAGAKMVVPVKVSGAFHSPMMEAAAGSLAEAIESVEFHSPRCPVYQNVDALPHTDPAELKANLLKQLSSSVLWTQSVLNMLRDGMTEFEECGPGKVLSSLVTRIRSSASRA